MAGVGEFVGYALRIVFGYLSDRIGRCWPITLWGYGLTFVAVPLLALCCKNDESRIRSRRRHSLRR